MLTRMKEWKATGWNHYFAMEWYEIVCDVLALSIAVFSYMVFGDLIIEIMRSDLGLIHKIDAVILAIYKSTIALYGYVGTAFIMAFMCYFGIKTMKRRIRL